MSNVKRVKVKTRDGKKAFSVLMDEKTFRLANILKVYATRDGYLYFVENNERVSFARTILGVIDSDMVVSYKNGNHLDLRLDNLEVITKGERGRRNLTNKKQQRVEQGIYYLFKENRFMVSVYLPDGTHRCPRAKTLEAARILRDRLYEIHYGQGLK